MIVELADRRPEIHPDAWIAPNATVIGDVRLAADASLWYGVVARADSDSISVGRGSNVQDNSVMHVDPGRALTIGEHCTLGHRVVVHGCTIGDRVLVGMGSIVMNDVVIGDECLIAAGSLVLEGTEIPAGSLVMGSPAKVRRQLTEEERAKLMRSAEVYLRNKVTHEQAVGDFPV